MKSNSMNRKVRPNPLKEWEDAGYPIIARYQISFVSTRRHLVTVISGTGPAHGTGPAPKQTPGPGERRRYQPKHQDININLERERE